MPDSADISVISSKLSPEETEIEDTGSLNSIRGRIGLFLGLSVFLLLMLLGAPISLEKLMQESGGSPFIAWSVFCVLCLMAIWWVTEAVPIAVTSLIPIVAFPLIGIQSVKATSADYMHPIVVLLMGGFIVAKAIERWDLHKRIALNVTTFVGAKPSMLIGGFMAAGAMMSMWISNSATTIMLTPIAISVAASIYGSGEDGLSFKYALLLGIAFACSIGGLGTPVGTPTNLIIIGYLNETTDLDITFSQWMQIGVPTVLILVPIAWFVVSKVAFKIPEIDGSSGREILLERKRLLGKMTSAEKRTVLIFAFVAFLWMFKKPLNGLTFENLFIVPGLQSWAASVWGDEVLAMKPLGGLTDTVTAIIGVLLCFLIPAGKSAKKGARILDWETAESIPWGPLLLFGGGLSLATAIRGSGLGQWFGAELSAFAGLPTLVLVMLITAFVIFLTEVMSNVATAASIMPVLGAAALASGIDIELIAAPIALAASCAFMLPMATGPNAVVYASGSVPLPVMAKAGVTLNIISIFVITAISLVIAPMVFS